MNEKFSHAVWPVIGLAVAGFCIWALAREVSSLSLADLGRSLGQVGPLHWLGAFGGAVVAYFALAAYDRVALQHMGRNLSWPFIAVASFVSYVLSHNIGAALISGGVVRYRIYSTKGLSVAEVAVLVGFCAFTFCLGVTVLGGLILVADPTLVQRFVDMPPAMATAAGAAMLGGIVIYVVGSLLNLPPLRIGRLELAYPRPAIVARQLVVGPLELIGAAAVIYFCLPTAGNPGFIAVLGIFLASFSLAIFSHAPGGIGVLEYLFVTGLRDMATADVLAALIIFRIVYLVIPLAVSFVIVLLFERQQLLLRRRVMATEGMAPAIAPAELPRVAPRPLVDG